MNVRLPTVSAVIALIVVTAMTSALSAAELKPGVRGLVTRAPKEMKFDGNLDKYKNAFCTPIGYFDDDLKNRAGQFFYMWDDEAFYCGLRTYDQKIANPAADTGLYNGDAVEWYFDTRSGDQLRGKDWGLGAAHMYWTGFKGTEISPRWSVRQGIAAKIEGQGVEVAARKTSFGAETEFKLPWVNFPDFKPAENELIALDAELCYGDGGSRVERAFAYGSPLSVQQPASQGKVQLVDHIDPADLKQCGAVMFPVRVDTEWTQPTRAMVTGWMAIPPDQADAVGKIVFRILDLDQKTLGEFEAKAETFQEEGHFRRAKAQWPNDLASPGQYHVLGLVYDKSGKELARVAPRLVSDHIKRGY